MATSSDSFNPFAPGFDFLQKLAQGGVASSASAFPQWSDWVAPTMSVDDLEKRIGELKTVLFWLEQNQRALAATIQAMEVQKMTLSALQTMNVPVENWATSVVQNWQQFAKGSDAGGATTGRGRAASNAPVTPAAASQPAAEPPAATSAPSSSSAKKDGSGASGGTGAEPLQWWSALTQQFQHIAQQAVQDVAQHAMQHAATTQEAAATAMEAMGSAGATAKAKGTGAKKPAAKAPASKAVAPRTPAKRAAVKKPAAGRK